MSRRYDHSEAAERYREGATIAQLAHDYGVTDSAIRFMLQRRNVELRGKTRSFDYDEAARMYQDGMLVKEIATHFGVTESSVRRAMHRVGVKVNPRQRQVANTRRRKFNDKDLQTMHSMRILGHSWRDIADAYEAGHSSVRNAYNRWLHERGERNGDKQEA